MKRSFHVLCAAAVSGILLVSATGAGAQERPERDAGETAGATDDALAPSPRIGRYAVTRDAAWSAPWLQREPGTPPHMGEVAHLVGTEPVDSRRETALPWETIHIRSDGGGVAVGDLLQLFRQRRSLPETGRVYEATGVVRVTEVAGQRVTADIVALYGLARMGDLARPVPAYDLEAGERPTEVEVSQEAGLLAFAQAGNVHSYGGVAFLDRGVRDGIRIGDEFVVIAPDALVRGGATQARLQVVGVAPDHTAARIVDLTSPVFDLDSRVLLDRRIR